MSDRYRRIKRFDKVAPVVSGFGMFVKVTISSITLITCFAVCVLTMLVCIHLSRVPNLSMLDNYNPGTSMALYDINDKLICTFPEREKREVVPLSSISPNLIRAVLAAEDHYFYEHHGVSAEGVVRAAVANVTARKQVQGGSTLTQQLVKNLFFADEPRTIQLKLAEGLVASQIESKYSKERILEIYLNQIYFGQGAYGAEQAAKTYFGKSAKDLSIAESAYLAGLIKSPTILGDARHRYQGVKAQQSVIRKMFEYGMITEYDAYEARQAGLVFKKAPPAKTVKQFVPPYPYYSTYVAQQVESTFNYRRHRRLKIFCNLDPQAQKSAETMINSYKNKLPVGLDQAAIVSMRLNDGAVLAMVGGIGTYVDNQWNSAVHPHTMGSAFKPFVYLTAFEQHILTPSSTINDGPLSVIDEGDSVWEPSNFDKKFMGLISVEQALAYSRNVCSVRVAQQTGIGPIIDTARRAGITETLAPTLALSLGASAASPLSMATAYGTLARGGVYMPPQFIRRIENERGNVLWSDDVRSTRALDRDATVKVVDILKKVVQGGTGTQSKLAGIPSAGKTGTANDAKDLWFVGFTPDMVTAIWTGNSENKSVKGRNITGGTVAAVMWRKYNQAFYATHEKPKNTLMAEDNTALAPMKAGLDADGKPMEPIIASPDTQAILDAQGGSYYHKPVPKPAPSAVHQTKGVTEYNWNRNPVTDAANRPLVPQTPTLDTSVPSGNPSNPQVLQNNPKNY